MIRKSALAWGCFTVVRINYRNQVLRSSRLYPAHEKRDKKRPTACNTVPTQWQSLSACDICRRFANNIARLPPADLVLICYSDQFPAAPIEDLVLTITGWPLIYDIILCTASKSGLDRCRRRRRAMAEQQTTLGMDNLSIVYKFVDSPCIGMSIHRWQEDESIGWWLSD